MKMIQQSRHSLRRETSEATITLSVGSRWMPIERVLRLIFSNRALRSAVFA